jgi:hypothetical protein
MCERISIDQETNLVSYLTCIEEISVTQLPVIHPLFAIGSIWKTDRPGDDVLKVRLVRISPDGQENELIETSDFRLEKERHRTNIILNGISFDQVGTYIFKVQSRTDGTWKPEAEIPLSILLRAEGYKDRQPRAQ